jgi:hypothetical protein
VPIGFGSLEEFHRLLIAPPTWADGLPIAAKTREGLRFNKPAAPGTIEIRDAHDSGVLADDPDGNSGIAIETPVAETGELTVTPIAAEANAEPSTDDAIPGISAPIPIATDKAMFEPGAAGHLILIDGSGYLYRSYYAAAGEFRTVSPASIFRRLLRADLQQLPPPTHLAVVFDAPGPTFRHAIYPDYKANRPPDPEGLTAQLPELYDVVRGLGIPYVERAGVEADDVIATYARQAIERGAAVTIVASRQGLDAARHRPRHPLRSHQVPQHQHCRGAREVWCSTGTAGRRSGARR